MSRPTCLPCSEFPPSCESLFLFTLRPGAYQLHLISIAAGFREGRGVAGEALLAVDFFRIAGCLSDVIGELYY